jgi:hypothetical protein
LKRIPEVALVKHDEMCRAIASAREVDEVKDIRDEALAIEVYSRQARNIENEKRAIEIRAERRCGQLLQDSNKALRGPGANGQGSQRTTPDGAQTLAELGITGNQSSRWQKLAAAPKDQFEATLAPPD